MAYEAQGQELDDAKEEVATEELVTTAELEQTYGDQIPEVISDVKDQVVSASSELTDDQIRDIIRAAAASRGITLSDTDLDRLLNLLKQLQSLGYDLDAFDVTLSDFESKLQGVTDQAQQASGFLDMIGGWLKGIADWFVGLFNGGNVPSTQDVSDGARDFFNSFNTDVFQWDSNAN